MLRNSFARRLFGVAALVSLALLVAVAGLRLLETRVGRWLSIPPVITFSGRHNHFASVACRGGIAGVAVGHVSPGVRLPARIDLIGVDHARQGNDWIWAAAAPAWLLLPVLLVLPAAWVVGRWSRRRGRGFEVRPAA